jgi:hypothetical protein
MFTNNNIEASKLKLLNFGIDDAIGYQRQVGSIFDTGTGFKDLKENLIRLNNALDKIKRGTADVDGNIRRVKTAISKIPHKLLEYLDILDRDLVLNETYDPKQSAFARIACSLDNMVEQERIKQSVRLGIITTKMIEELAPPGKGGARNQARKYNMGIQCLARHFKEVYPDRPLSSKYDSYFYRYVLRWLVKIGHINSCDMQDKDITRHMNKRGQSQFK